MSVKIKIFFDGMSKFSKDAADAMPKVLDYYAVHKKVPHIDDLAKDTGFDVGKAWDAIRYLESKGLVDGHEITEKGLKFYNILKDAGKELE
jgi:hypothetical protein